MEAFFCFFPRVFFPAISWETRKSFPPLRMIAPFPQLFSPFSSFCAQSAVALPPLPQYLRYAFQRHRLFKCSTSHFLLALPTCAFFSARSRTNDGGLFSCVLFSPRAYCDGCFFLVGRKLAVLSSKPASRFPFLALWRSAISNSLDSRSAFPASFFFPPTYLSFGHCMSTFFLLRRVFLIGQ